MNGQPEGTLLRRMDRLGIERAIIVPWDRAIAVDNRAGNEYVARLAAERPDRFVPFCTVNPWYGDGALAELDRAIGEGARGLKLHPMYQGFQLTDPFVLPVVERAVKSGLPIYIPTGTPVASLPLQLSHLAEEFPEGIFIQGHFGFPDFWIDAVPSVLRAPNIYVDTAYNMPSSIENAISIVGSDRVIWSSDAPYLSLENEHEKLRMLDLSESVRRKIGRQNIMRVLGEEEI